MNYVTRLGKSDLDPEGDRGLHSKYTCTCQCTINNYLPGQGLLASQSRGLSCQVVYVDVLWDILGV